MTESLMQQARVAFRQGRLSQARAECEEVLRARPKHFQALRMLGVIELRRRRPKLAMEFATRAIESNDKVPAVHFELGLALSALSRREDAVRSFARAIELKPDFLQARNHLDTELFRLGRHAEALASADEILTLKPDSAVALNNRGAALIRLGRLPEALESLDKALQVTPDNVSALGNRGHALQLLGRYAEALESCDRALAKNPLAAGAHLNRSVVLLRMGELLRGFEEFEWRWKAQGAGVVMHRYGRIPLWSGEPLQGKRILLHAEQGLGDSIQFLRYAPMVRKLGAVAIVQLPPALLALAKNSLGDTIPVVTERRPVADVDFQCPLMSLPRAFKTELSTIPGPVPYLRADPASAETWAGKLGHGRRIGLAWAGRKEHHDDRNRSIGLRNLLPILESGKRFASLQKEISPEDRVLLADHANVLEFSGELRDFADTAALIEGLDLVISIDTSVAHLAGALGKPVWILLPYVPDWRWLLERSDSPWYPTARLFRQPAAGDWGSVIAELQSSLAG